MILLIIHNLNMVAISYHPMDIHGHIKILALIPLQDKEYKLNLII